MRGNIDSEKRKEIIDGMKRLEIIPSASPMVMEVQNTYRYLCIKRYVFCATIMFKNMHINSCKPNIH